MSCVAVTRALSGVRSGRFSSPMAFRNACATSGRRFLHASAFSGSFQRRTYSAASLSDFATAGEFGKIPRMSRASPSGATVQRTSGSAGCARALGLMAAKAASVAISRRVSVLNRTSFYANSHSPTDVSKHPRYRKSLFGGSRTRNLRGNERCVNCFDDELAYLACKNSHTELEAAS